MSSTNRPTRSSVGPNPKSSDCHHGVADAVGFAPTVAPCASNRWKISSLANTGRSVLNCFDLTPVFPGG
jgi:hypothetical protein